MTNKLYITVFTPTYNRATLLPRLFESLCKQTYKDFEWVIVDDGSIDNTKETVQHFAQAFFPVRYYFKDNGGKHSAINLGSTIAKGEAFFIADSDDILPPESLERVSKVFSQIAYNESFAGVCGLDMDFSGKIIGEGLPCDTIDSNSMDIRTQYHVKGDLKEVFKTKVLKEFSFPIISGEKFFPELYLWNRIATKYKLRFFNQPIYMVEYQPTGLTASIIRIRMNSPIASMMTYSDLINLPYPILYKLRAAINYWRFWCCRRKGQKYPHVGKSWIWAFPMGYVLHLADLKRVN